MSNWIHLNLRVENYDRIIKELHDSATPQRKPEGIYKELITYLKKIVDSLSSNLINRYFYFFEPNPLLFLALEVKNMKAINSIRDKISQIKAPNFIETIDFDLDCHDEGNGKAAIDFFHTGAKYAFFRVGKYYKPRYHSNDEIKLMHCFCNQLFVTIENETKFYAGRIGVKLSTGASLSQQ